MTHQARQTPVRARHESVRGLGNGVRFLPSTSVPAIPAAAPKANNTTAGTKSRREQGDRLPHGGQHEPPRKITNCPNTHTPPFSKNDWVRLR